MSKKPIAAIAVRSRVKALTKAGEALSRAVELLEALSAVEMLEALQVPDAVRLPDLSHSVHYYDEVSRFKVSLICRALELTRGNQTKAASLLGLKVTTLNQIIKRHKIEPKPLSQPITLNRTLIDSTTSEP